MRYGPSTKERLIVEDLKIDGFEDLALVKWCGQMVHTSGQS